MKTMKGVMGAVAMLACAAFMADAVSAAAMSTSEAVERLETAGFEVAGAQGDTIVLMPKGMTLNRELCSKQPPLTAIHDKKGFADLLDAKHLVAVKEPQDFPIVIRQICTAAPPPSGDPKSPVQQQGPIQKGR